MTVAGSAINSATSSPLQGLPPSTNISFLSCSQEQLIEQIVSRKFIEVRLGSWVGVGVGDMNEKTLNGQEKEINECKEILQRGGINESDSQYINENMCQNSM